MWLLFEFYLSTDIDNIKAAYPDYRKARNEMQELVRAQKNIERFLKRSISGNGYVWLKHCI